MLSYVIHVHELIKKKLLFSVRNADRCFLSEGFSNWKKAIEKFREHQQSKCHRAATESMIELPKKCGDVAEIHSDKLTKQKQLSRRIFVKVLVQFSFSWLCWPSRMCIYGSL